MFKTFDGIDYYLYLPESHDAQKTYPLLIFLHGASSINDTNDPSEILKGHKGTVPGIIEENQWPTEDFIVASPHLKRDFSTPRNDQRWPLSYINSLITSVTSNHKVDAKAIYLTGISLGAKGVWSFAMHHPEKIAAIVPIAGNANSDSVCFLDQVPVWAFHSRYDEIVETTGIGKFNYLGSSDLVKQLNKCNPEYNAQYTDTEIIRFKGHNGWKEIYMLFSGFDIYEYLLAHKKGSTVNIPPFVDTGAFDRKIGLPDHPVLLNGWCFDSDGNIISMVWTQTAGTPIEMEKLDSSFVLLHDLTAGDYVFRLTVKDNESAESYDEIALQVVENIESEDYAVKELRLLNLDNNDEQIINDGFILDYNQIGESKLVYQSISASNKSKADIYESNFNRFIRIDGSDPYLNVLPNDAWKPSIGTHYIGATSLEGKDPFGIRGFSLFHRINVVNNPQIVEILPSSASPGEKVKVAFQGFSDVYKLKLNDVEVPYHEVTHNEIEFILPAGASSGKIALITNGGLTITSNINFTVEKSISNFYLIDNSAPNLISSWSDKPDGNGAIPDSFTGDNQNFYVTGNASLTDDWKINGSNTCLNLLEGARFEVNGNLTLPCLKAAIGSKLVMASGNAYILAIMENVTLDNGAILQINGNELIIAGHASINQKNSKGEIWIKDGSISFKNSSTDDSYLYFNISGNEIRNLTISNTANGIVHIMNEVKLLNTLFLKAGSLQTNNHLILKAGKNGTARIAKVGSSAKLMGKLSAEHIIGPGKVTGWYNLGTGIKGTTLSAWQDDFTVDVDNKYNIRYYDEPADAWQIIDDKNFAIVPGYGVQVYLHENDESLNDGQLIFDSFGEPVIGDGQGNSSGNYAIDLSVSGSYDGGGWNLVSNPYLCEIDWDAESWSKDNIINSYYIWDGAQKKYHAYVNGVGTGGLNGFIPSGQAFFVKAVTSGQLLLNEDVKDASGSNPAILRCKTEEYLSIIIKDTYGNYDETIINLSDNSTHDFDPQHDALKFENPYLNLGTFSMDSVKLSINSIPIPLDNIEVPLTLGNINTGNYSIHFNGEWQGKELIIKDKYSGEEHLIDEQSSFIFTFKNKNARNVNDRFSLVIKLKKGNINPEFGVKNMVVFPNPADELLNFIFKLNQTELVEVKLYSASGSQIFAIEMVGEKGKNTFVLPANGIFSQNKVVYYTIHSQSFHDSGKIISKY